VVGCPPAVTLPLTLAVLAPVFETALVMAEKVPVVGGHAA
jgi:hypothetical protein